MFTNPWDTTQPPDTQPANLLGQDLRNLKVDIQERMGAISGTFAARPTPDTGNANFTGILYFTTDTAQVFRWNGATWDDVTAAVVGGGVKDYDNYIAQAYFNSAPGNNHVVTIGVGGVQSANAIGSFIEYECGFSVSAFVGTTPQFVIDVGQPQALASFQVGQGTYVVKGSLLLSNGASPRAYATLFGYNGVSLFGVVQSSTLGTQIDGTVPVAITEKFQLATTISARSDYLHVRVRK